MATAYFTSPKRADRLAQLWEDLLADAEPPEPATTQGRFAGATALLRQEELVHRSWKVNLTTLFQSLLEPEVAESLVPPTEEAISEGKVFSERSLEAAHEASLAISSPFHWEPKPAWINIPGNAAPAFVDPSHPPRFAAKPKIPIRPLHKQPFYSRFFFYLRRWLGRPR